MRTLAQRARINARTCGRYGDVFCNRPDVEAVVGMVILHDVRNGRGDVSDRAAQARTAGGRSRHKAPSSNAPPDALRNIPLPSWFIPAPSPRAHRREREPSAVRRFCRGTYVAAQHCGWSLGSTGPVGDDDMRAFISTFAVAALLVSPAGILSAQSTDARPTSTEAATIKEDDRLSTLFVDIFRDIVHFPSEQTGVWLAGAGGASAFAALLDDRLSSEPGQEWGRWSETFDPGTWIGNGAVLGVSAAVTYGAGRAVGRHRTAVLGRDLLRAQALAGLLTHAVKITVRRQRPDGSSSYAFPSGHASTTFASAVVISRYVPRKWAFVTYGVASYVAVSRMHENRHYLSDVVFGSGLGIASGLTVMRNRNLPWEIRPALTGSGVGIFVERR